MRYPRTGHQRAPSISHKKPSKSWFGGASHKIEAETHDQIPVPPMPVGWRQQAKRL